MSNTALTKLNLSYLQWRYLSNASRTWRAWQSKDLRKAITSSEWL